MSRDKIRHGIPLTFTFAMEQFNGYFMLQFTSAFYLESRGFHMGKILNIIFFSFFDFFRFMILSHPPPRITNQVSTSNIQ